MIEYAVLGGFVLDCLFGDPAWLPHPVVYMGKAISRLEKFLRARLPKTPQGELLGGAVLAFCLPVGTLLFTGLVCWGAAMLHPLLGLAVQMFWCGQALADGEELLVILAHGGTQKAAMERYALPRRENYAWCGPNAGGYVLDAADWAEKRQLHLVKTVQYTKDAEAGV